MNKIPRFSGADLEGIAQLLDAEGIPFGNSINFASKRSRAALAPDLLR
ncbi:MAG: hypothetical protein ACNA77_02165 [Opitutales bacterium]